MNGLFNEMTYFNGVPETVPDILKHYDDLGGPHVVRPLRGRLGRGGRHALHLDQAGRLELRRHPQRHGRPLAPSGSRPRARSARSGITSSTSPRRSWKRPACPSRRSVNGTPQTPIEGVSMVYTFDDATAKDRHTDPVLRDLRQPRHLPRRLAGRHRPPGAVGAQSPGDSRQRHLGALRHPDRLQPGQRPGREEPGKAQGDAGPLHEGSGQVPRAADRRPHHRAHQRRHRRSARPDGRPHVADGLSRE